MNLLDLTLPTPAENLACDEALLDWCEEQEHGEILRFWESSVPFVVVGYANKIETEVNIAACQAKNIPIFRRCSGGGTVVQGRGCLNYALILRIIENSPTAGISGANRFIMERNGEAIRSALGSRRMVSIRGHTDLTNDGIKFSGNAQRRRKHYLLFHGTFLWNFDLGLISEFLQMPSQQPDYRKDRKHEDFVSNLSATADEIKAAMRTIWRAKKALKDPPLEKILALASEKYASPEWNFKF
ncbi:MAG TPA: lipoate--protein ligase family protein [Verrucomicrobiae bacterium]|jgi:lipoate-protein ligase A